MIHARSVVDLAAVVFGASLSAMLAAAAASLVAQCCLMYVGPESAPIATTMMMIGVAEL